MSCTRSLLYLVEKDGCFHQQGIWPIEGPYFRKKIPSFLFNRKSFTIYFPITTNKSLQTTSSKHLSYAQQGKVSSI